MNVAGGNKLTGIFFQKRNSASKEWLVEYLNSEQGFE